MSSRFDSSRNWTGWKSVCIVVIAMMAGADATSLGAQVFAVAAPADADSATPHQGFTILKADSKLVESIEDFDRYVGKKSWELAFRAQHDRRG